MLASHLARCAACRAFEESARQFTEELRSAPLESPKQPIVVRRTRRVSFSAAQVSVAAALAIAVLGVASQLGLPEASDSNARVQLPVRNMFTASWRPEQELAQIDDVAVRVRAVNRPGPNAAL